MTLTHILPSLKRNLWSMIVSVFGLFRHQPTPLRAHHGHASFLSPYSEHWDWGRLDLPDPMRTARTGIARYRLSVYPPGTTDGERRDLFMAKCWWLASATATLVAELIIAGAQLGGTFAAVLAAAGCSVSGYWLARTRTIRRGTRALQVAVVMVGHREVVGDAALFGECRLMLTTADRQLHAGASTAVEREMTWSRIYGRLAPKAPSRRSYTGDHQ